VTVAPAGGGNLTCDATQGCNSTSFGQVQFRDGNTVLGTVQVQEMLTFPTTWTASFSFVPAAAGTHGISAAASINVN
jgi:hypothetical protein